MTQDILICTRDLSHGPHAETAHFCCICGAATVRFADAMADLTNLKFALQNFKLEAEDTRDGYIRVQKFVADRMLEVLEETGS